MARVKRFNAFAVAGLLLAFAIWPLGLLFSIIGLVKSKARAGSGQGLSIAGIVVSLVEAGIVIWFLVALFNTGSLPGCSAENDFSAMLNKFNADGNALMQDQGDSSAERAAAQHFIGDAQTLRSELTAAAAQAQDQSIRAKIGVMTSDLDAMTSSLHAVSHGDANQINQVFTTQTALTNEATSLISLCPPSPLSAAPPIGAIC